MQQIEERRYQSAQVRSADATSRVVSGLAISYAALSDDLGGWRERISPGAFTASLADGHDVRMLFSHDPARILGSTRAGTLSLQDGKDGLRFRCNLPDTTDGQTVRELVGRADLRELSFGFRCEREDWLDEDDPADYVNDRGRGSKRKIPVRHVRRASLHEISVVAWPAYSGDSTHIKPEVMAATAAGRSLFPGGTIPMEIRSRVPTISLDPVEAAQQRMLRADALQALLSLGE